MIRKKVYIGVVLLVFSRVVLAQTAELELARVQERLDSIQSFEAQLTLELDVEYIEMPTKKAQIIFQKGKPLAFEADNFVMLPKKGLDFTMRELFKYPYMVVDRGYQEINGERYRQLSIIPQDRKADFAIATLLLDNKKDRIISSEISTKKQGTYSIAMAYGENDGPLPDSVTVSFEIQDVNLPIQYLTNNTDMEIDKKSVRSQGINEGRIYLMLSNYQIRYKP